MRFKQTVILIIIVATCIIVGCNRKPRDIPEPDYQLSILKPGRYVVAAGKEVNMDSVAKPQYLPAKKEYKKAGTPEFIPLKFRYYLTRDAKYYPLEGKVINMDTVPKPRYVQSTAIKLRAAWPEWISSKAEYNSEHALPFFYLSTNSGLRNNTINALMEDRYGRVWIGTDGGGVSVWDGNGFYHFNEENGLINDNVMCLMEDSSGKIWIGTFRGVSVWDGHFFTHYNEKNGLIGNEVWCFLEDDQGKIWIGTHGGLSVWDGMGFYQYTMREGLSDNWVIDLYQDRKGDIWISGLTTTVWNGSTFTHYKLRGYLNFEDSEGRYWFGSISDEHRGIKVWDGKGYTHYSYEEGLNSYSVHVMIKDSRGRVWAGGYGGGSVGAKRSGISVWDGKGFYHYSVEDGLSENVVLSMMEDRHGNIWMGTHTEGVSVLIGGGKRDLPDIKGVPNGHRLVNQKGELWISSWGQGMYTYDNQNTQVRSKGFLHYSGKNGLQSPYVASLLEDPQGDLWITSMAGLNRWDGTGFTNYMPQGFDERYIDMKGMVMDKSGHLWIQNWKWGIMKWDGEGFTWYTQKSGLTDDWGSSLLRDHQDNIWIGTDNGLNVWDGRAFTHFTTEEGLSHNSIIDMLEDERGRIWICTDGGGLNIWDGKGFIHCTTREGLSSNYLHGILQDEQDIIWISSDKGLNRIEEKEDGTLCNNVYSVEDGLQGIKFTWLRKKVGFGDNANDFRWQRSDTTSPKLAVQTLGIYYDRIDWSGVHDTIRAEETPVVGESQYSLSGVNFDSVTTFANLPVNTSFPYNINQMTLTWQGVHLLAPHKLRYTYLLEGQDNYWSPLVSDNKVSYTDIRPGDYTFKVRAIGGNGKWSDTATYSFTIRPPIWSTAWAYSFYVLCILGLGFFIRHYERQRFVISEKARTLEELDRMKTRFFTNISHEFRTPLTLILGPLRSINDGTFIGDKDAVFGMMIRNGQRLLRLINQLLDLSKIEAGSLKLKAQEGDVARYIRLAAANFESVAVNKKISLNYSGPMVPVMIWFDHEKMERILFNLVGNAIKFTPIGGKIDIALTEQDRESDDRNFKEGAVKIVVRDSGEGIHKKDLPKIFNRFYQAESRKNNEAEGTGIGLALVKELVELHHGAIEVESEEGWGTTFTILLPKGKDRFAENELLTASEEKEIEGDPVEPAYIELEMESDRSGDTTSQQVTDRKLPVILIVEDNIDMRHYIRTCLGNDYFITEAVNGKEGLATAAQEVPDMILSDVMMPEMDGNELCYKIRENPTTSHIPLILLTAKADQDSRISGLMRGADDYLSKPFDADELRIKIHNQLNRMRKFRSFFSRQLVMQGDIEQVESLDDQFMKKAFGIVEEQLDNSDFTVEEFARLAGMSQTQLYRKVLALTGQTPNEFIRSIRLKKAAQLILQQFGNVSDVAYAVGFNNLSYFAKCFKKQFGVTPNSYGQEGKIKFTSRD